MHLAPLIRDLAVILGVAALVTLLFQKIRQPVVLGYIIAGLIIGPFTPPYSLVTDIPNIQTWAELGVIFLMFSLGLEFSFRKLAKVGGSASLIACFEVLVMLVIGYFTGQLFGWSNIDSLFLGAMLSISSTTIIIRALDELKLKTRRFSELIFAVLIVEDLVAVLILVGLSTLAVHRAFSGILLLATAGKLILVIGGWFIAGYFLVPRVVKYVGRVGSNEMLTTTSLGLCLSLATFAAYFHYSVALGAFIMGSIIAESTESHRIEVRMEPLRDLFAAVFFVSVGMLIDPVALWDNLGAVIVISCLTIAGKILSTTIGSLISGQTLRTSVQVGFGLAQIGEFSFIIASLGLALGVTSKFLYSIAVAVSLVTTFTTPYLIKMSHNFAVALENRLPIQIKDVLNRYAAWTQARRSSAEQRKDFYQMLFRWAVNGIIVSLIFILDAEVVLPAVKSREFDTPWLHVVGWLGAIVLSGPSIWAMFSSFKRYSGIGTVLTMRLFTVIWVGALCTEFFPAKYVALIILFAFTGFFAIFYKQLETWYQWFEQQFLVTFEMSEKSKPTIDVLKHLAPWDAHLVRIKAHPNSKFIGLRLLETELRSKYGLNVVAIQRGIKTIVAPKPTEVIYPKDELLVLGTDEQIDTLRPILEKPPGLEDRFRPISGYELRKVRIPSHSVLENKTIRESGIREKFDAMVVGLERNHQRMINPESDLQLNLGDLLWIVGEKERLDKMDFELFTDKKNG